MWYLPAAARKQIIWPYKVTSGANHPHGGHLITSAVEHQAVLNTFRALEAEGYSLTVLPVDSDGRVCPETLRQAIRPDTVLISIMYANNETGTVQPVQELGAIAREHDIVFHADAVQAFGYLPVHPIEDGIDLLTVCSHKYMDQRNGRFVYPQGIQLVSRGPWGTAGAPAAWNRKCSRNRRIYYGCGPA